MKRRAVAAVALALVIPINGAIAGSGSTSGTDLAFFDPNSGYWQFEGGGAIHYGAPDDLPLLCDWNGNGKATVGVYRDRTGYLLLSNLNASSVAEFEFYYGIPRDIPLCGDWNGDGVDTIAIYRTHEQKFYLRNTNDFGFANVEFQFGFPGGLPFSGDWNGDGIDTVGVRDPKNGFMAVAEGHKSGVTALETYFGSSQQLLVIGDWDGDDIDQFGLYDPSANTLGVADSFWKPVITETYQLKGDGIPLSGEWNHQTGVIKEAAAESTQPQPINQTDNNPDTASTATTTTVAPAPPPAPGPGTDWYGPGVKGVGLRPRTAGTLDWALGPFAAPRSGNLDSLALHFVFENGNYFQGSGGINRFSIRSDVNGQPGPSVLGELTITNPTASGGIWSDWATRRISASHIAFDSPVPVTGGARYWIVGENLHSDPVNNWVGINALTEGDGAPGTAFVYIENSPGSNVFERFEYPGEGWFTGLFDLTYQEDDGFGQGYWIAWFPQSVGGNQQAREVFTPSQNHTISGLQMWADRSSGSGALTATLSSNGTVIAQASASGSGRISFPMSTTLTAGTTYSLEFSAPSGTTYTFYALRENAAWSSGSRFVEGYADYHNGSNWTGGWHIWGQTRQQGDLMFYFTEQL